mmetsp:Transcript_56118/g.93528  ORF Transcript_56118/g.93528 Transcript_56118/m.93528 type:complete len:504 (+) Transcript_56118:59-1570(+)
MSDTFTKLSDAKVEPSLQKFQDGAVGSIEMLSMGFYGIIEAFKDEMQKSRDVQDKIEESMSELSSLRQQYTATQTRLNTMSETLNMEVKKIKKHLSEQSAEVDKKLISLKQTLNDKANEVKQECMSAVDAVSNRVGQSLQNLDRLQQELELANDQLRALSVRCDENKELIEEQDNKFKDDLNELTQILHHKALELDEKIDNCLSETTHKIAEFDGKQQQFQFEMNGELAQKADINDLKHKLDKDEYQRFVSETYAQYRQRMDEHVQSVQQSLEEQRAQQSQMTEDVRGVKEAQSTMHDQFDVRLAELQSAMRNPVDADRIKHEIVQQFAEDQQSFREEMLSMMQQMLSSGGGGMASQAPMFGTQSGNCIACGRGPSQFQPLPNKSPSPSKKPKHGGGFNRLRKASVSGTSSTNPTTRRILKMSGSDDNLTNIAKMQHFKSPETLRRKSVGYTLAAAAAHHQQANNENVNVNVNANVNALKEFAQQQSAIDSDAVHVKIPDIND